MNENHPDTHQWLDAVQWDAQGLVPAIAQDATSGDILMVAWMNREALALTASEGRAVYWSRSRRQLWRKGEESGHQQQVLEVRLDCDDDVIVLKVEQRGGIACHTGRRSCFFKVLRDGAWHTVDPVLKDPAAIYGQPHPDHPQVAQDQDPQEQGREKTGPQEEVVP